MESSNIFAKKRKELRLKQSEVAQILNIDRSSISKWETGDAFPDVSVLPKIADLYKVSIDYLFGREEDFNGLNIITEPLSQKKSEIQILFDELEPQQQASVIGYAKGMLANSGKDLNKLVSDKK